MGLFGSNEDDEISREEAKQYLAEDAGSTVKIDWIRHVEPVLNDDEEVYHMMEPGVIKHGGNTSANGPGKTPMVAFTGERVVIRVPHYMWGDDEFSIRYNKIQSVELDTNPQVLTTRYLRINTANDEYGIQVPADFDEDEERNILNWVDKKSAVASSTGEEQSSGSAEAETEQKSVSDRLEELEELHEKGVVDDEEYESKKQELLDEL